MEFHGAVIPGGQPAGAKQIPFAWGPRALLVSRDLSSRGLHHLHEQGSIYLNFGMRIQPGQ